jgi:hypothetical protein
MHSLRCPLIVLAVLLVGCGAPSAEDAPAASADLLEGAWFRVEVINADGTISPSRPALRLYADGHYSAQLEQGTEARPPQPDSGATDAELVAAWRGFASNGGTYTVSGDVITENRFITKDPANMLGGFATLTYRIVADTLWLTQTETQNGTIPNPSTSKFVRARRLAR